MSFWPVLLTCSGFFKGGGAAMNKIQVGGFIRISKREAERRYNAGETVRFCACKLSPVNMWGCFCDCKREVFSPIAGDGFNTVVPRNREFETVVNAFRFYNCNGKTGRYPAFYVREAAQL